jgi:hypothetical protein
MRGIPHRRALPAGWRKNVVFHVILLDGTRFRHPMRTKPGRFLTPNDVEKLLESEAKTVERFFPGQEFRLVPLRGGNFNLVEVKPNAEPAPETVAAAG